MARVRNVPKNVLESKLPEKDKLQLALKFLREHSDYDFYHAIKIWKLEKPNTLFKKWSRERKKKEAKAQRKVIKSGGNNRILDEAQEAAVVQYAIDQAIDGGKGATRQMMFQAVCWLREQAGKELPFFRWFQLWLKGRKDLHVIKTKPIDFHRVDMHTEHTIKTWFEREYMFVLVMLKIHYGDRIFNMDEKGARICVFAGEEVVVSIGI